MVRMLACLVWVTLLLPLTTHAQPGDHLFEVGRGLSLTDDDRSSILEIATTLSDAPITRIVAQFRLPSDVPIVIVSYAEEVSGTFFVRPTLEIHQRYPMRLKKEYLQSLRVVRGNWATDQALLRREVLRLFSLGSYGKVALKYSDGLSYTEVERLLAVVAAGAIVWEETAGPRREIGVQDIRYVGSTDRPLTYEIRAEYGRDPVTYLIRCRFDGHTLIVTKATAAMP